MSIEFKKRKVVQNRRRRATSDSENSDEESAVVLNEKRNKKSSPFIQSTSNKKLKASEPIHDMGIACGEDSQKIQFTLLQAVEGKIFHFYKPNIEKISKYSRQNQAAEIIELSNNCFQKI